MRVLSNWANLEAATCCFGTELVLSFSFLLLHADNFMNESWISTLHSLSSRKYRQISVADSLFFFLNMWIPFGTVKKWLLKDFWCFVFIFFFFRAASLCPGWWRSARRGTRRKAFTWARLCLRTASSTTVGLSPHPLPSYSLQARLGHCAVWSADLLPQSCFQACACSVDAAALFLAALPLDAVFISQILFINFLFRLFCSPLFVVPSIYDAQGLRRTGTQHSHQMPRAAKHALFVLFCF